MERGNQPMQTFLRNFVIHEDNRERDVINQLVLWFDGNNHFQSMILVRYMLSINIFILYRLSMTKEKKEIQRILAI